MKRNFLSIVLGIIVWTGCTPSGQVAETGLKDAFENIFFIGAALNVDQIYEQDADGVAVVKKHFNSVVAENCMKSMYLQPREGAFYFDDADRFVAFGEQNKMQLIGHTLIWHSQAPAWFFQDENDKDVTRELMIERMKNHITTVVGRYKGRIQGWDVVNEALNEDGTLRNSKFLQIIGPDYIPLAFQFAHEADPEAELYYNDYGISQESKREGVIRIVQTLKEQAIRIDGVGMQGHMGLDYPDIEEFEKSIVAYSDLGVKVMVTEMDITVLPFPSQRTAEISLDLDYQQQMNPYAEGLPDEVNQQWEDLYLAYFKLFLKHRDKISRVTLWGVSDAHTWRNDWPMKGRTDYPLLFDRNYQPKAVVSKIINLTQ